MGAGAAWAECLGRGVAQQAAEPVGGAAGVRPERGAASDGTRVALRQSRVVERGRALCSRCLVGQEPPAAQQAQRPRVDPADDVGDLGVARTLDGAEGGRAPFGAEAEDAVECRGVEVRVEPEVGAEALRDGEPAALRSQDPSVSRGVAVALRQDAGKETQHGRAEVGVVGDGEAELEGERENPLADGHVGQDVVHKVGGGLGHVPAGARGAEPAALAGERQSVLVAARRAADAREAVSPDPAAEERTDLTDDERGE